MKSSIIMWIGAILLLTACTQQLNTANVSASPGNQTTNQADQTAKNLGIQKVKRPRVELPATANPTKQGIVLPSVKPLKLSGRLRIAGSQVVFPITQAIAERFIQDGYPSKINSDSLDTATGFKLFCNQKKADIVNALRPINNQELAACAKSGLQPIGFKIGMDALTIVASSRNDFLPNSLSRGEIIKIFTLNKWSDVNPNWPKQKIKRVVPAGVGTGGGFDLFAKVILQQQTNQLINAPNTIFWDFVEQIYSEALTNPYMIGFLEYGSYKQNKDTLKVISIDGVPPSARVEYPLTRVLYIYADKNIMQQRPEVEEFINYYLTYVNEEIEAVGFFPLTQMMLNESKKQFLRALNR